MGLLRPKFLRTTCTRTPQKGGGQLGGGGAIRRYCCEMAIIIHGSAWGQK